MVLACRSAGVGVPARRAGPPARRDGAAGPRSGRSGPAGWPFGPQVPVGQPELVLAGAGDRAGPPGRRCRGQRPLPHRPGPRPALRVEPSFHAPGGQVTARQRTQVRARGPQHGLILRADPQPGPDPRATRGRCHERCGDHPQCAHTAPPEVWSFTACGPMFCCAHPRSLQRPVPRRPPAIKPGAERGQYLHHVPHQVAGDLGHHPAPPGDAHVRTGQLPPVQCSSARACPDARQPRQSPQGRQAACAPSHGSRLRCPQISRTGDPIGFSPERNGIKCRGNRSITLLSSRSRPSGKWSTPRHRGRLPRWRGNSISMMLRSGSG